MPSIKFVAQQTALERRKPGRLLSIEQANTEIFWEWRSIHETSPKIACRHHACPPQSPGLYALTTHRSMIPPGKSASGDAAGDAADRPPRSRP